MKINYSDIDLAGYFSGELSLEEKKNIEEWSNASPENLEMFKAARFVWEKALFAENENYDTEKALLKVHGKIESSFGTSSPKTRNLYLKIAAIAAVILFPVIILFFRGDKKTAEIAYTEISSGDTVKYLKLTDGSEVWLNVNSKIIVADNQEGDEFRLKLEGEAYFQISHNPTRVFIVETNTALVKVLGTAFNLKARKSKTTNILSVTEGKVLCSKKNSSVEKIVEKGKEAEVFADQELIRLGNNSDDNFLAWKTKVLKFRETPFKEVAATLENYYNIRIEIADTSLDNLPISTTIVNEPVDEVIKYLLMASDDIVISKNSNGYMVNRKK